MSTVEFEVASPVPCTAADRIRHVPPYAAPVSDGVFDVPQDLIVQRAVEIASLHRANLGATVNLADGDQRGQHRFALTLADLLVVPGLCLDIATLIRFISSNLLVFSRRDRHIGTWQDRESGASFVGVAASLPRYPARKTARWLGEHSCYDLVRGIEVPSHGRCPSRSR
jgi:hypothetical protein